MRLVKKDDNGSFKRLCNMMFRSYSNSLTVMSVLSIELKCTQLTGKGERIISENLIQLCYNKQDKQMMGES